MDKKKTSLGKWIFGIVFWGVVVLLAWMKGCEKRNYLLHPVTDEEIEQQEAVHNRGG